MEAVRNRFSSLTLTQKVSTRNKIIVPPMASGTANEGGFVTKESVKHYGSLATSKAGIIMVEYSYVDLSGRSEENQLGVSSDDHIHGLSQLADVIHSSGSLAGLQITHSGGKSTEVLTGGSLMAPSSIVIPVKDETLEVPREMNDIDILNWKKYFVDAALRASKAGFDIVELHAAHGYGLNQWLSPITNLRQDEYGGSLQNRTKLLLEIISAIKSVLPRVILAVRVPGQDLLPGGLSTADMIQVSQWLEAAGVGIIDVSSGLGGWRRPRERTGEGYLVSEAAEIQSAVQVPVVGVGGIISGAYIDLGIQNKWFTLAAVGRAISADSKGWFLKVLCPETQSLERQEC